MLRPASNILFWGFSLLASVVYSQPQVTLLGNLPEVVTESSGLLSLDGRLITHNDSGNEAVLYELDAGNFTLLRTIEITGTINTDWEDIARDDNFIYIGDIGNNLGQRQDLKILRISLDALGAGTSVTPEVISYSYEDQTDFSGGQNSDWDAEALVVREDDLLIFTKQWQSGGTVIYRLPKVPGAYQAERIGELPVGGLITAGHPFSDGTGIALLGYSNQLQPFMVRLPLGANGLQFPTETTREPLEIGFGQAEGLLAVSPGVYLFSTESFSNAFVNLQASVFRVEFTDGDPNGEEPGGEEPGGEEPGGEEPGGGGTLNPGFGGYQPQLANDELRLFGRPFSGLLEYAHGSTNELLARAIYDSAGRRIRYEEGPEIRIAEMDVSGLGTSIYYFTLYLREQTLSRPFIRY